MEELKRIEMTVRSEDELKKYGDWEIIGIWMRSSAARHSYKRFEDENGELKVRCSHESSTGRYYESNTYDWEDGYLGTLNTLKEVRKFYCDNWITYVAMRKDSTIIHATITDGKIFR